MIIFDHALGKIDADNQDEILLYHLVACIYICFKVDVGFSGLSFKHFLGQCEGLPSYNALKWHLAPHLETCFWPPQLFPLLENEILCVALNFKTSFVSCTEVVCSVLAALANLDTSQPGNCSSHHFELFAQEALFRSYICLQGKSSFLFPRGTIKNNLATLA